MRALILAAGAVLWLSSASAAKEEITGAKTGAAGRVRGAAAAKRPAARSSGTSAFTGNSVVPQYASSSLPPYGGSLASGAGMGSTVRPLRPMARSRTSGSGAFVAGGPVLGGGSYNAQEAVAPRQSMGSGYAISAGKGRTLTGQGVTTAQAPDGAGANGAGSDPLSKIMAGIAGVFGDMAKMLGGG